MTATQDNSILQSYNGLIRFYDGTVIAIEDQEYSPDGQFYWEKTFNPNPHISTLDGVTEVGAHKYKRVKHSGDINFQLPYRIVSDEPEFRVQNNILQYKLIDQDDTEWKDLFDLSQLQGEDGAKGDQGIPGEGWNLDLVGYFLERPDCCSSSSGTSCSSCNPGNTSYGFSTFMSLGDGLYEIQVGDAGVLWRSNDGITWLAIVATDADKLTRYTATDALGTGSIDYRTQDTLSTRGKVYICADGTWTELTNVATPSYMVGERLGSPNINYLNGFIDDSATNMLTGTIGIDTNGKLEVVEQTIDETAFAQTIVDDGLEIPSPMDKVRVNPSDFTGFGLATYTSDADSLLDIQVLASDLLGDGIAAHVEVDVDGETRELFQVNPSELINNNSGIIATAQGDTFEDFMINLGDGLELDGGTPQAITIDVDDLSLEVDATSLRIKPYSVGNDGILTAYLNPDVIYPNRGLALDPVNGLQTVIDASTIGYTGSGELEVINNGITGDKLNDDTADNTKGIEVLNDALSVKVDGSTIDFNGSGELEYIGAAPDVVTSITAGGVTVKDDIIYNVTTANGSVDIDLSATINPGSDTIDLELDVNTAWLSAYIVANHPASPTAWGAITGTITDQTDLVNYIDGLSHVVLDTWYNDTQISSIDGLVLKSSGGTSYRVIVDNQGNLDTLAV